MDVDVRLEEGWVAVVADGAAEKSKVAVVALEVPEVGRVVGMAPGESHLDIAGVPWPRSCIVVVSCEVRVERFWKL